MLEGRRLTSSPWEHPGGQCISSPVLKVHWQRSQRLQRCPCLKLGLKAERQDEVPRGSLSAVWLGCVAGTSKAGCVLSRSDGHYRYTHTRGTQAPP